MNDIEIQKERDRRGAEVERRELGRDWLKTLIDKDEYMQPLALASFPPSMFPEEDFRNVYEEIRRHISNGIPYDFTKSEFPRTLVEITCEGKILNGSWSIVGEELLDSSPSCNPTFAYTDAGNSERFVSQHGRHVRFDHTSQRWYLWTGKLWAQDERAEVEDLMLETVRSIYAEAESATDSERRKSLAKWGTVSESYRARENAVRSAMSIRSIAVTSEVWDVDPLLLCVLNGTLDLNHNTFLPFDHRHYLTKMAGTAYDPKALCPKWLEFLSVVFNHDENLIAFVQRLIGYSLTGLVDEQILVFGFGRGLNGKTIFSELLRLLFGNYFQKAPSSMLMLQKNEPVPIDIARLRGCRIAVMSEVEEGRRLAEVKVKELTGGDRLVARHLFQELFEFNPTHKLWLFGNHRPQIVGTDLGIWRRILLIPFSVTIPQEVRRPQSEILNELRSELPGILNWAIEGLLVYKSIGLKPPEAVKVATEQYREESDIVQNFLDECCSLDGEVSSGDLHKAFVAWGGNLNSRRFFSAMQEHGCRFHVGRGRQRIWEGVSLSSNDGEHGV